MIRHRLALLPERATYYVTGEFDSTFPAPQTAEDLLALQMKVLMPLKDARIGYFDGILCFEWDAPGTPGTPRLRRRENPLL